MADLTEPTERIDDVLTFWLQEVGEKGWFRSDPAVDDACRTRFGDLMRRAEEHGADAAFASWRRSARGALALLILTDQMPRNVYRNDPRAFAADPAARAVAEEALARDHDLATPEPQRLFFYMPFEHSERLIDQDRAVSLITERFSDPVVLEHAEKHRDLILRFGRFPHRNAALRRPSTAAERAHLDGGGYQPGAAPARG